MAATQNAINNLLATTSLTGTLQAAQFPALSGPVTTVAGALATTIVNNAITTAMINNAAVTYAKIQNEATVTLLGNPTGAPAAPSEITLGTNLSFAGSVLNATFTGAFVPMPTIVVTGTTQAMATNTYYVANNAGACTMTLPAVMAKGDEIMIGGIQGSWILAQNSGQLVNFGNQVTTTGTGGSVGSQNAFDNLHIKCVVANTTFNVIAAQGNMTVT